MRHKIKKLGLFLTVKILVISFLGYGAAALAGDAILTWNPNTEPDLTGYKVYFGTASGIYGTPIVLGNQTTYTVTGLGSGTYYFTVTAYDTANNESGFSTQVSKTFSTPDTTPPVISAITAGSITNASAVITWSTDEAATSLVEYGMTTAYGLSSALNSTPVTNHSTALSSLAASTLYHYRVKSTDASGNLGISGDNTFTSLSAPDTTPPTISGITVSNITGTGAGITWTTNESADTQIQYGITTAYGSSTTLNTSPVLTHTQSLTGLLPSTLYNFSVRSRDAAGNLATSSNTTFTTSAAPDTTPPSISGLTSSNITSGGATITWSTNEPATTQVDFGTTTAYGSSTALNSSLITGHTAALSGLTASATYHYRVKSADAAGNLAVSGDNTFITSAAPDITPPVISGVISSNITSGGATITWSTNEPATTQVDFGTTTAYGSSTALNSSLITGHTAALSGLTASATYHYRVKSADAAGNLAVSGDNTFITSAPPDTTAPTIANVVSGNITSSSAVITWSTNEASSSQVEYGTTTAYGSSSPLNTSLLASHSASLGGLTASATYHYRVKSADAAGNLAVSGDNTFITSAPPDTTAPTITNVVSGNITSSSAVITWSTNEAASSQVEYGTTTAYGSSTTLNSSLTTGHTAALSGLTASAIYHYRVKSADAAGNTAASTDNTFTLSAALDTTGPVLSLVSAVNITPTGATISWGTDEPATTQVKYRPTMANGNSTAMNATLLNSHSQTLTGLLAGTLYHYRVKSADAAGNLSVSGDNVFTTAGALDTTPPGNVQSFKTEASDQQITLSWVNPSDSDFIGARIRYRTDRYPSNINDGTLLGDFTGQPNESISTVQTSLENGATYYYSASSYDNSGNYQQTAYSSATVSSSSNGSGNANNVSMSGGCGMVRPGSGKPPGPGQAADMITLLAVVLIAIIKREIERKKIFDKISIISDIIYVLTGRGLQYKGIEDVYFFTHRGTIENEKTRPFPYGRHAYRDTHALLRGL